MYQPGMNTSRRRFAVPGQQYAGQYRVPGSVMPQMRQRTPTMRMPQMRPPMQQRPPGMGRADMFVGYGNQPPQMGQMGGFRMPPQRRMPQMRMPWGNTPMGPWRGIGGVNQQWGGMAPWGMMPGNPGIMPPAYQRPQWQDFGGGFAGANPAMWSQWLRRNRQFGSPWGMAPTRY